MNWKISKFHDTQHMANDLQMFGSTTNVDAGKGEAGLKQWTKLPAKTASASRGQHEFTKQLSHRSYEQTLLRRAMNVLVAPIDRKVEFILLNRKIGLFNRIDREWKLPYSNSGRRTNTKHRLLPPGLTEFLSGGHPEVKRDQHPAKTDP